MKVYTGIREGERVTVSVDGQPLDARLDLRDFHASGFEWGYEGSGPSQLALAILADHADPQTALGNYRKFVQIFIAEIEDDSWRLTSDEINQRISETTIVPMDLKTLMRKVRGEI
ncbi:MAG: hypothetical protein HOK21_09330 [Rhodospirillaceae bacterium]|nr:hypothetical protein [Rhodospirillaceae bacterium]MBT5082832.1 hypothetical protein [Rhodospirillaceae bacterium]MBT5524276.1 hypothetical protein [Rhodospirillaceae bacterium]MBT5878930.1 hypothetical protein [Rhodospirillaceae bacterium]MBT6591923.1 hypothetical protein [Rhodospirillaceae bacterium]